MKSPARVSCQGPVPLAHLQTLWQGLSLRYFENRLPAISIEWSSRLTASTGLFVSEVGPRSRWVSSAYRHGSARVIRLSSLLLRHQSEEEIRRTLAHEMIHQWEFDIRKRRPSHGQEFRMMMDRMNRDGLGITVRHQLDEVVGARNRYAWQCLHCGMDYHRQRRTIIPSRHICSRCGGTLVERDLEKPQNFIQKDDTGSGLNAQSEILLDPMQLSFDF